MKPDSPTLERRLSLPLLIFYGIGTILGAGIYVLVGKVAGEAGMFTPVSFVVASLLATFSAFSYAELSSRYPRSAGEAIYIEKGFGIKWLSMLVGLMIVSVGIVSTATLAHGFAGYFKIFLDAPELLIIVLLVASMWAITCWGIGQSVMAAAIMTIAEIIGLLIILYVGREAFALVPVKADLLVPDFDMTIWAGILMGSFIAFYAYLGFEDIVNVAEEAIEPKINLPRAIIVSLIVTTIFYILISVVSVILIPPADLASSDAPLSMVYVHMTGESPVVITVISLLSVLNGALIQVIMASRVLYGMSRKQWLPGFVGRVNATTHTPVTAISIVSIVILIFTLIFPLLSLAKITSFITLLIFMLINLALLKIKLTGKEESNEDIYFVPIWIPLIGFISCLGFVAYQVKVLLFA